MEIQTKNASLSTMAVTIQALHVDSKQMTLSVFRQLPILLAYREDGSLAELEHWGLVRYAIKNEASIWLVASKNGVLYRCDAQHRFGDLALAMHRCERAKARVPRLRALVEAMKEYRRLHEIWCESEDFDADPPDRPKDEFAEFGDDDDRDDYELDDEDDPTLEKLLELAIIVAEIREHRLDLARRADASRATLMALPQLFIAV